MVNVKKETIAIGVCVILLIGVVGYWYVDSVKKSQKISELEDKISNLEEQIQSIQNNYTTLKSEYLSLKENSGPTADAGPDQIVKFGDIVYLYGNGVDTDGNITLYEWDFDDDGTHDWSSNTSGSATHVYNITGTYVAVLRVTDNYGATGEDVAIITVTETYTNLLKNPGFEDGAGDDPLYWYRAMIPVSGLNLSWDSEINHSGNRSVSISNTHEYDEVVCNNWAQNIELIPVEKILILEGWIKTIDVESVIICIQCWNEYGVMLAFGSTQDLNGTHDWGKYNASVIVPSGTSMITIRATLTGTGQVWFDDITLLVKQTSTK